MQQSDGAGLTFKATPHLAIIIPFREDETEIIRRDQLRWLLFYLIPILQRQQKIFKIFVISQDFEGSWNKGRLFNIGFKIAKSEGFNCFVLHDVDMIMEDDRAILGFFYDNNIFFFSFFNKLLF